MKPWLRRVRGAIGMGLSWAAGWFVAGIVVARVPGVHSDLPPALLFAPLGFLTGIAFAGILGAVERGRSLGRMSLARFAGWGAAGGLLLSGLFVVGAAVRGAGLLGEFLLFGPALATAGAVCAAGSLALAQRAERHGLSGSEGPADDAQLAGGEDSRTIGRGA